MKYIIISLIILTSCEDLIMSAKKNTNQSSVVAEYPAVDYLKIKNITRGVVYVNIDGFNYQIYLETEYVDYLFNNITIVAPGGLFDIEFVKNGKKIIKTKVAQFEINDIGG